MTRLPLINEKQPGNDKERQELKENIIVEHLFCLFVACSLLWHYLDFEKFVQE
jgi:hypothetical protein